jgi:hypothetical protein
MALKRYRVLAEDTKVLEYATGDEFEFDFEEGGFDEAAVLASGALEEVGDEKPEPVPEPTKQELLDRTAELGISSNSSMSKAEIKKAIDDYEAQQGS